MGMMMRNAICYLFVVVLLHTRAFALQLGSIKCRTRRDILIGAAAASLSVASVPVTTAVTQDETPQVTALVKLDLSIARGPSQPLRIELFGNASPASVEFFSTLASSKLRAPCADDANLEKCEEYQGMDVGYKGSQLWRLVPNKRLDFGRVDSMFASRIPPTIVAEGNGGLLASSRGAVSVKRGGGAFEFTIAPMYNKALDNEDLVVIGRVVEDDMAFLDVINSIPTRKDIIKIGEVPPLGSKFARACDLTAPDSTCAQFKPLKKIIVTEASVTSQL
jgi:cyclophilin family peptidyl-prolyl cis-trans isomerase